MRIAVVVKLKVFKVLRIDSTSMNSSFWEDFGPLLSQIWPSIAEILTRDSNLAKKKKTFEKNLKDLTFHKKETDAKFALLVQL